MTKWKKAWIDIVGITCVVLLGITSYASSTVSSWANSLKVLDVTKEKQHTQVTLSDEVDLKIPFAVDSLCYITDPQWTLASFLDQLDLLLLGEDTVVKIVHLGDSHVQAGFYSGQVMRMLQNTFGNAGRGWISPLKLAKVNEPRDYYIKSPSTKEWTVGRCIHPEPKCAWGVGGLGIQAESNAVDFEVSITPNNGAGYEFNEVFLYRNPDAIPMLAVANGSDSVYTSLGMNYCSPFVAVDTFRFDQKVNTLQLQSAIHKGKSIGLKESVLKTPNCYYGFSLQNGKPGVLYHSIGQNGAMFINYTNRDYMQQLSLLEPSILIITLGTNEAFGRKEFQRETFTKQIDQFVQLVKEYLPSTAIVLTTPAESFRRVSSKGKQKVYERNPNIEKVAQAITEYAQVQGLACFDLYGMTGAANSCKKWEETNLLGKDRIHFSVEGYEEQGKLLYKALVRLKMNQQNTASIQ